MGMSDWNSDVGSSDLGRIEGAQALSVSDEAKRAHEHEEECLFFVALSRARTHLTLSLARKQPNGNNRSPSPYLDWLPGGRVSEIARPAKIGRASCRERVCQYV